VREIKHLSVHQWLRSAIPDSQQPSSPIGFLFLKLPPPPCAVLLVGLPTTCFNFITTSLYLIPRPAEARCSVRMPRRRNKPHCLERTGGCNCKVLSPSYELVYFPSRYVSTNLASHVAPPCVNESAARRAY